jgi:hypothetical protein
LIRHSLPEDTAEISRLAVAQYQRTPWPLEGYFPVVQTWHLCERQGCVRACCGFRIDGDTMRVMHVWAEDGFGGRRAAVELMLDLEAWADAGELDLVFDTMPENVGLQAAVEEHGCVRGPVHPGAVEYRRKARVLSSGVPQ